MVSRLLTGFIFLFSIPLVMFPQISGTGTYSDPSHGTLLNDSIWPPSGFQYDTIFVRDITIPANRTLTISPDEFTGIHIEFIGQSQLTIQAGGTCILNPKASVTVNNISNNGLLIMESYFYEPGVASLIHTSYSGNGTTIVKVYLKGGLVPGEGSFRWHYVSVPISGIGVGIFNTLNLAQYVESLVEDEDNTKGWVAWDGYRYTEEIEDQEFGFSTLKLGTGYNYYSDYDDNVITLSGVINIADTLANLTCGLGYPESQGYNLLGNPFTACLDWDELVASNPSGLYYNAVYITHEGAIASYVAGLGVNGGTATIPPMQGFFVKASGNYQFSLKSSARVHNNNQMRYKKRGTHNTDRIIDTISYVRLKMHNPTDTADLIVRFNKSATVMPDKNYDAFIFNKKAGNINMWTTIGGTDYSINGLPFPETTMELPIGINVNKAGTYTISLSELNELYGYTILLKDLATGKTVDLRNSETLDVTVEKGLIEDRFLLTFLKNATYTVDQNTESSESFRIYSSPGIINLVLLDKYYENIPATIKVYDLTGRVVLYEREIIWTGQGELQRVQVNHLKDGIYIIELSAKGRSITQKFLIQER